MYKFRRILLTIRSLYMPDPRALSLMRIGAALLVIADLCIRCGDLQAHYTNSGVLPNDLANNLMGKPGAWSIHGLFDSTSWVVALFALHFVFAGMLLMGYKTKLANLLVWLLTISLHNRNIYVLQAGDDLLRLLLFWGLFLPWGASWSFDSRKGTAASRTVFFGGLGYLLLIASVYFFTMSLKTGPEWRSSGEAIYYALSLDQLRLPFTGDLLYRFPALMKILTWLVCGVEWAIPALILWPSKTGRPRFIAFVLIVILHVAIGLTLYVGLFFLINMVSGLGLLPPDKMDRLEQRFGFPRSKGLNRKNTRGRSTFPVNIFCATVIVLCLIVNLSALSWFRFELKPGLAYAVNTLRIDQYWGMFSPTVLKKDGWYVYYGVDGQDRQWDLRLNQDYVDFKKPGHVVSMYKTDRWRKLAENMQMDGFTFLRPLYGKYYLRRWNREHPEKKMVTLMLYFMEKENLPDYKTTPVEKKLFCVCNDR